MKFTLDGKKWELDESTITFAEAEQVEKVTEMSFIRAGLAIMQGHLRPQRAMMWIAMKREKPELKFEDLGNIAVDSVEWSFQVEKDDESADGEAGTKKGESKRRKKASVI